MSKRRRQPTQDQALARINRARAAKPGYVSIRKSAHLPTPAAAEWDAMSAQERGRIILAGLNKKRRTA